MADTVKHALYGSFNNPIKLGPNAEIELYPFVLEDGSRVLSQKGVISALGMNPRSGPRQSGEIRLVSMLKNKGYREFVDDALLQTAENPILFYTRNQQSYGFPAEFLVDICTVILNARDAGELAPNQEHIARRAEILIRAFAKTAIVALIDEVTGFQAVRQRDALQRVINDYISEDLQEWTKTFPDEYYTEIFRLRGMSYSDIRKRPACMGRWTNDIVYSRLAPGVLDELRHISPRYESGRLRHHFHRRLTRGSGHPQLTRHLEGVLALMRASEDWDVFKYSLQRAYPKHNEEGLLPFAEQEVKLLQRRKQEIAETNQISSMMDFDPSASDEDGGAK